MMQEFKCSLCEDTGSVLVTDVGFAELEDCQGCDLRDDEG